MPAIDGLASGLDTTAIINQLMQIERLPQARLQKARTAVLSQSTAWSTIGSNLKALGTVATTLSSATALARTAATSSSTAVGITAQPTAAAGSHTLTVTSLATSHVLGSGTLASGTAPVGEGALVLGRGVRALGLTSFGTDGAAGTGTYAVQVTEVDAAAGTAKLTVNGTSYDVATRAEFSAGGLTFTAGTALTVGSAEVTVARTAAGGTVADLAAQVGAARGVASAAVVEVGPGSSRLLLSSTRTGTQNGLEVVTEGLTDLGLSDVRPAADAQLTFDGLALTRQENTVSDLVPGVTLALQAPASEVVLAVNPDATASTTAAQELITSLNTLLGGIGAATRYDPVTKTSGALAGDGGARGLVNTFRSVVSTTAGTAGTLAAIGVKLERDGSYTFDETAFSAALSKDPTGVADTMAKVATALSEAVTEATSSDGAVTSGTDAAAKEARDLQDRVDAYDVRLALTQSRITRQFTELERVMGLMQSQGNALAGQLGSLPTWSS